jgi:sarcosine oxidase
VLCSACSGHGFKFAPVIGSILADLASSTSSLPGTTPHDISLFRLSRQRTGQAAVLDAFAGAGGGGSGAAARL